MRMNLQDDFFSERRHDFWNRSSINFFVTLVFRIHFARISILQTFLAGNTRIPVAFLQLCSKLKDHFRDQYDRNALGVHFGKGGKTLLCEPGVKVHGGLRIHWECMSTRGFDKELYFGMHHSVWRGGIWTLKVTLTPISHSIWRIYTIDMP